MVKKKDQAQTSRMTFLGAESLTPGSLVFFLLLQNSRANCFMALAYRSSVAVLLMWSDHTLSGCSPGGREGGRECERGHRVGDGVGLEVQLV